MNWQEILTSSLIATILSSAISAYISYYIKKVEFRNEYYKIVIQKRIEAYELLESQIARLKQSTLDTDSKAYHTVFAYDSKYFLESITPAIKATSYSIWINPDTLDTFYKLKDVLIEISFNIQPEMPSGLILEGKRNYKKIALIRDELEFKVRRDILTLYKLDDLKSIRRKIKENPFINMNNN
jgi:hypothetical protein